MIKFTDILRKHDLRRKELQLLITVGEDVIAVRSVINRLSGEVMYSIYSTNPWLDEKVGLRYDFKEFLRALYEAELRRWRVINRVEVYEGRCHYGGEKCEKIAEYWPVLNDLENLL